MNHVAPKVQAKWFQVGIQLNIDMTTLQVIGLQPQDPLLCCTRVFVEWERAKKSSYTWATIIRALESEAVKEKSVANELQEWLKEKLNTQ